MGNSHSASANQENQLKSKILENYTILQGKSDKRFGDVTLLTDPKTGERLCLKELLSKNSEEFLRDNTFFKKRVKIQHPNLVKLITYAHTDSEKLCATMCKFLLLLEYLDSDLEEELKIMAKNQQAYTEEQLNYLLESVVSAFNRLQLVGIVHGDVRPQRILMNQTKQYKIVENNLMGQIMPSYYQLASGFNDVQCYLSPSLLTSLKKGELHPTHHPFKSDVFSLGMIVLYAGLMKDPFDLYDFQRYEIKENELKDRMNKFKAKFSQRLSSIVEDMLNFNEESRPDFIKLMERFKSRQNLQGKESNVIRTFTFESDLVPTEKINTMANVSGPKVQASNMSSSEPETNTRRIAHEKKSSVYANRKPTPSPVKIKNSAILSNNKRQASEQSKNQPSPHVMPNMQSSTVIVDNQSNPVLKTVQYYTYTPVSVSSATKAFDTNDYGYIYQNEQPQQQIIPVTEYQIKAEQPKVTSSSRYHEAINDPMMSSKFTNPPNFYPQPADFNINNTQPIIQPPIPLNTFPKKEPIIVTITQHSPFKQVKDYQYDEIPTPLAYSNNLSHQGVTSINKTNTSSIYPDQQFRNMNTSKSPSTLTKDITDPRFDFTGYSFYGYPNQIDTYPLLQQNQGINPSNPFIQPNNIENSGHRRSLTMPLVNLEHDKSASGHFGHNTHIENPMNSSFPMPETGTATELNNGIPFIYAYQGLKNEQNLNNEITPNNGIVVYPTPLENNKKANINANFNNNPIENNSIKSNDMQKGNIKPGNNNDSNGNEDIKQTKKVNDDDDDNNDNTNDNNNNNPNLRAGSAGNNHQKNKKSQTKNSHHNQAKNSNEEKKEKIEEEEEEEEEEEGRGMINEENQVEIRPNDIIEKEKDKKSTNEVVGADKLPNNNNNTQVKQNNNSNEIPRNNNPSVNKPISTNEPINASNEETVNNANTKASTNPSANPNTNASTHSSTKQQQQKQQQPQQQQQQPQQQQQANEEKNPVEKNGNNAQIPKLKKEESQLAKDENAVIEALLKKYIQEEEKNQDNQLSNANPKVNINLMDKFMKSGLLDRQLSTSQRDNVNNESKNEGRPLDTSNNSINNGNNGNDRQNDVNQSTDYRNRSINEMNSPNNANNTNNNAERTYPSKDSPFSMENSRRSLSTRQTNIRNSLNGQLIKSKETYPDGSVYEGEMLNGQRHGYGIFTYSDGGLYEGEWKYGTMDGQGTLYYSNGKIAYQGGWKEDKFHGKGSVFNELPDDYGISEEFDFRNFDTLGEFWANYEGDFIMDNKEGFGILYVSNGERYEGGFKNDMVHGKGIYFFKNGETLGGIWDQNLLVKILNR